MLDRVSLTDDEAARRIRDYSLGMRQGHPGATDAKVTEHPVALTRRGGASSIR